MQVGHRFLTKSSGYCEVIDIIDSKNVFVQFDGGWKKVCQLSAVKSASIKNPYHPSVFGVGFLGEGPYITSKNKILTQESITWRGMLQRCYDEKFLVRHPSYTENYVCDDFHNYQNFAGWCQFTQGFGNKSWCLDKDIIIRGNKEYNEYSCCFVPHEINNLIISSKSCRGDMPIGVYYRKKENTYSASCNKNGKQVTIGRYKTEAEAFNAYKLFKEQYIRQVATKWKNEIDVRVYESLMQWEVYSED